VAGAIDAAGLPLGEVAEQGMHPSWLPQWSWYASVHCGPEIV